jgi:hypothetical protein
MRYMHMFESILKSMHEDVTLRKIDVGVRRQ